MGIFWGMENFIVDCVIVEVGLFLEGYQGVMLFCYFYDWENVLCYDEYVVFMLVNFIGILFENYMLIWGIQVLCGLEIVVCCMCDIVEVGKELIFDNLVEVFYVIDNWDMGGFFGGFILFVLYKIGIGCVY